MTARSDTFYMKAAVIRVNGLEEDLVLLPDKTVTRAYGELLKAFFLDFKQIEQLSIFRNGQHGKWDNDDPMIMKPSTIIYAYITDSDDLIVYDSSPFRDALLSLGGGHTENLIDAREYALRHGKSIEQIKVYCRNGRLKGARQIGKCWAIPEDTPYPEDGRITANGIYRGVNMKRKG